MTEPRTPNHHDAELVLRLYEMRRETVMRASRDAISFGFWPKSWDELQAIFDLAHADNAAWRQVVTYWEMVFGFGRRGLVEPELLVENSGEGILLYMKVRPFIERLRQDNPTAFQHTEWAATQTGTGRQKVTYFEARVGEQLAPVGGD